MNQNVIFVCRRPFAVSFGRFLTVTKVALWFGCSFGVHLYFPKPLALLVERCHGSIGLRLDIRTFLHFHAAKLKVAFIEKVLMHLSFPQTDKLYYFPELEFWICDIIGLISCQIRAWSSSEGTDSKMKPYLSLLSHFRSLTDIIWAPWNFKIQAQENNKVCLFEEMTNASVPSE